MPVDTGAHHSIIGTALAYAVTSKIRALSLPNGKGGMHAPVYLDASSSFSSCVRGRRTTYCMLADLTETLVFGKFRLLYPDSRAGSGHRV